MFIELSFLLSHNTLITNSNHIYIYKTLKQLAPFQVQVSSPTFFIHVSSLNFNSTRYKFVFGNPPSSLTLLLLLADFHPPLRWSRAFPHSFRDLALRTPSRHEHTSAHTYTLSLGRNARSVKHAHTGRPVHLVAGKFPAILRLLDRNNSSCPVKLLRFPRTTCATSPIEIWRYRRSADPWSSLTRWGRRRGRGETNADRVNFLTGFGVAVC